MDVTARDGETGRPDQRRDQVDRPTDAHIGMMQLFAPTRKCPALPSQDQWNGRSFEQRHDLAAARRRWSVLYCACVGALDLRGPLLDGMPGDSQDIMACL